MKFINENPVLRVASILVCFIVGLVLVFTGWKQTGELGGLIQMLIGVGVLLTALAIYNYPYRDKK
ncbi:MAG: hypothetical protein IKU39_02135 [Lachnospiraceae bacterium]|nr:hypothetical protein [Lachnospiraceae bacterium]